MPDRIPSATDSGPPATDGAGPATEGDPPVAGAPPVGDGARPAVAGAPPVAGGATPLANRARATVWVTLGTAFSKPLGYVRDAALAAVFGANSVTDAFFVAQTVPQTLFLVVALGLGTTYIPVYTHRRRDAGDEGAHRSTDAIFTMVLLAVAALVVLFWVFAPQVVWLVAPGFSGATRHLAIGLTRAMLPSMIFLALATISVAALQVHERFTPAAFMGVPYNLVLAASIIWVGTTYGIDVVAWGVVAAVAAQWLYLIPAMRSIGFHWHFRWDPRDPGLRRTLSLLAPVVVATSAAQVGYVADRLLASLLPAGRIAALSYGNRLFTLPNGIFVGALVTVAYPLLAQRAAAGDFDGLRHAVNRGMRLSMAFLMPFAIGLFVLREPIVRLLFQHGHFSADDTTQTALAAGFFMLGLLPMGAMQLLKRAYFSLQDTRTPMIWSVVGVCVNVAVDLLLLGPLAQGGLALATSMSLGVQALGLLWMMRGRLSHIGGTRMLSTLWRALVAGGAMAAVEYLLWPLLYGWIPGPAVVAQIGRLVVEIAVSVAVYGGLGWVLGLREFLTLAEALPARWRRRLGVE